MNKKFEILERYEAFNLLDGETHKTSDTILLVTAIPFIGTFIVLFYFLVRKHERYLKEVK